jgi:hypothetical protein
MRRMSDRNTLITISWRDIPVQVTARNGGKKASVYLGERFQTAVDKAAARAGKDTADEYLSEWRRTEAPCGPDLEAEADQAAAEIERRFSGEVLGTYIAHGGFRPDDPSGRGRDHP